MANRTGIDRNAAAMNRTRRNWQRVASLLASTAGTITIGTGFGNALILTSTGYGVFGDNSTLVFTAGSTLAVNAGNNLAYNPWFSTDKFICRGLESEASNPSTSTLRSGDMWFNSTTSTTYLYNYSTIGTLPWVLSAQYPNVKVSSTTVETSLLPSTIPLAPGSINFVPRQFKLKFGAVFPTAFVLSPVLTLRAKYGTSTVWTSGGITLTGGATGGLIGEVYLITTSTGAPGQVVGQGIVNTPFGTVSVDGGTSTSISTNASTFLDFTAQWNSALNTDSIRLNFFSVEVLK